MLTLANPIKYYSIFSLRAFQGRCQVSLFTTSKTQGWHGNLWPSACTAWVGGNRFHAVHSQCIIMYLLVGKIASACFPHISTTRRTFHNKSELVKGLDSFASARQNTEDIEANLEENRLSATIQ
jgi:hypothetical protein